jgi:hypothetical protein
MVTFGNYDVIRFCGICIYKWRGCYGDPFNHPPFVTQFLKLLPDGLMFRFILRLPLIVAEHRDNLLHVAIY